MHVLVASLDQIASVPDQPPLSPIVLIALLKRIFSIPNSLELCSPDEDIDTTIYYLEYLEKLRKKRIKALQKIGGQRVALFLKNADSIEQRYTFALQGIKIWVHCLIFPYWLRLFIKNSPGSRLIRITFMYRSTIYLEKTPFHSRKCRITPHLIRNDGWTWLRCSIGYLSLSRRWLR